MTASGWGLTDTCGVEHLSVREVFPRMGLRSARSAEAGGALTQVELVQDNLEESGLSSTCFFVILFYFSLRFS